MVLLLLLLLLLLDTMNFWVSDMIVMFVAQAPIAFDDNKVMSDTIVIAISVEGHEDSY